MIIWATFAMLITATPIFTWRHMLRQAKKNPADAPPEAVVPAQVPAQASARTQYQPQPLPTAPHAPVQKPSWADSHTHDEGNDQTMQIALGGLGGRKE
jgi:hypothetical protein